LPINYNAFGERLCITAKDAEWLNNLQPGDQIDALKYNKQFMCWTRATVINTSADEIEVEYHNETEGLNQRRIKKNSFELAELGTRSLDFDWRQNLKLGDIIDYYTFYTDWNKYKIVTLETNNMEGIHEIKTMTLESLDKNEIDDTNKYLVKISAHSNTKLPKLH